MADLDWLLMVAIWQTEGEGVAWSTLHHNGTAGVEHEREAMLRWFSLTLTLGALSLARAFCAPGELFILGRMAH
jgi:hypothetical protein